MFLVLVYVSNYLHLHLNVVNYKWIINKYNLSNIKKNSISFLKQNK